MIRKLTSWIENEIETLIYAQIYPLNETCVYADSLYLCHDLFAFSKIIKYITNSKWSMLPPPLNNNLKFKDHKNMIPKSESDSQQ